MNKWIPLFLVAIGAALAEPPAPNYVHSNYDYQKPTPRGSYGHDEPYGGGESDDGYKGESDGGGGGDYGSSDEGGQGHGESYSNAAPASQGDDYGYNDLSPEKPYGGSPQDHMTHSYSPPTHYNGPRPGGYSRPGGLRFRMPALIKNMLNRRRPQKVYMVAHSAPSYSSFGSSHGGPYSNDVAPASYGGPHTSSASTSSYGGSPTNPYEGGPSSSSYGGPSSSSYRGPHSSSSHSGGPTNSYDSPPSSYSGGGGGSGKYDKPPKYYEGHLSHRPVKPYSAPSETYGQYPSKSQGPPSKPHKELVKPPRKGYSAPPPANQYGDAMKGVSSPEIANFYGGGVGNGYVPPMSSYAGRPSKGNRNKGYRPSQPDYDSGYNNGNRNSGHDYAQQDVYGGGFDRGTSHY